MFELRNLKTATKYSRRGKGIEAFCPKASYPLYRKSNYKIIMNLLKSISIGKHKFVFVVRA